MSFFLIFEFVVAKIAHMKEKNTYELLENLKDSESIEQFIRENKDFMINESLSVYLSELLQKKNLKKNQVLKNAEISEIYGYQIFSGVRVPSRDKLLSITLGMGLTLEETNQTLKYAGFAPLYAKNKRDSIIIWGIEHSLSIPKINNELYDNGQDTL